MCVMAQTAVGIYNNDETIYNTGVLRGTTNPEYCDTEGCDHSSCNLNRSGAIKYLFREVTFNAETGEPKWGAIRDTHTVTLQRHRYLR